MPRKAHPSDWDRLFSPNAPRRYGPVALFLMLTTLLCLMAFTMVGAGFGTRKYENYQEARALTATPLWKEYYAQQTATALAEQATPTAAPTAVATATAQVIAVGNVRSEPRIAAETIIGQVAVGDSVAVLEPRDVEGMRWYRVVVTPSNGAASTSGWVSSTLLQLP